MGFRAKSPAVYIAWAIGLFVPHILRAVAPCQLAWHEPESCQLEHLAHHLASPNPSRSPPLAASGWDWGA
jgi:hypothetical protein